MGLSEVNSSNGGISGCRLVSTLLWILSSAMYVYLIGTFVVASISMCWEGKRVRDLKKARKEHEVAGSPTAPTANLAHLFAPNFGAGHGMPSACNLDYCNVYFLERQYQAIEALDGDQRHISRGCGTAWLCCTVKAA